LGSSILVLKKEDIYSYALITSAYNEKDYLPSTIEAVLGQRVLPQKWVIVSDGSTDGTDAIINEYATRHSFIRYLRIQKEYRKVGFASKVYALNEASRYISETSYEFIGNLDADITFESSEYFLKLMDRFDADPKLGISGGSVFEPMNGKFKERAFNNLNSVAGAIQFFRRKCFEELGGFQPIDTGGEDTIAEICARAKGWKVITASELIVYHHKKGNVARGSIREGIRQGKMDYLVGTHPLFELLKCAHRIMEKPYFVKAIIRGMTFFTLVTTGRERFVTKDIMEQLRKEQKSRMRRFFCCSKQ